VAKQGSERIARELAAASSEAVGRRGRKRMKVVGTSIISRFLWLACGSSGYPGLLALPVGRCNEDPAPKIPLVRGKGGRRPESDGKKVHFFFG